MGSLWAEGDRRLAGIAGGVWWISWAAREGDVTNGDLQMVGSLESLLGQMGGQLG